VRPWGFYWVTAEGEGDAPVIAEWCCADARRNEGFWWLCGAGAYDDSPRVKEVLAGPLEPPGAVAAPPQRLTTERIPWVSLTGCPGCGSQDESGCLETCPLVGRDDKFLRTAKAIQAEQRALADYVEAASVKA
jgi:hypothetical protein